MSSGSNQVGTKRLLLIHASQNSGRLEAKDTTRSECMHEAHMFRNEKGMASFSLGNFFKAMIGGFRLQLLDSAFDFGKGHWEDNTLPGIPTHRAGDEAFM